VTRLRFFGRRLGAVSVSVFTVFTLSFFYIVFAPYKDTPLSYDQVPASRTDPLLTQYLDMIGWFLTIWDDPVLSQILEGLQYTSAYLVPALVFAIVAGISIRIYTVSAEGDRLNVLTDGFTLFAISVPIFFLAYLLRRWFLPRYFSLLGTPRIYDPTLGPFTIRNLQATVWPVSAMALFLVAIQLHYAGEELREYISAEFVKTARAKGVSRFRVGRHVFRNTAIPLLTLFFTDMFGVMVIGVFVIEYITHVPGIGELTIQAVLRGDLPLMLGLTVLFVMAGVIANFLQDIAYQLFDPRVQLED
jgi:peptide/nickel transport system permease protein